jgi:hypothetical protein
MKYFPTILVIMLALTVNAHSAVWHVDKGNTSGIENGETWDTAFTTIQPAIDAAFDDGGGEVWVAEGVYNEQRTSIMYDPPVDTGSLVMKEDVDLYGGFAGIEETREQRNWEEQITVIDGSVARDGEPAHHVVIGADRSILDGFTITGGLADGDRPATHSGAGMYNDTASPTISNCTFRDNSAEWRGGGMYNEMAFTTVTNCLFQNNWASARGGGMSNVESSPTVIGSVFEGNSSSVSGGGMHNDESSPTLTDCMFKDNSASNNGAGIYNESESSLTMINCVFLNNSALKAGGGMYNGGSSPTVLNCTFQNNSARVHGGGIDNRGSSPTLTNCILWDNSPESLHNDDDSYPVVLYSDVQGGSSGEGNIDTDPLFVDETGGDLRLSPGSPCMDTAAADGAPDTDLFGVARPQGAGVDMGAYEIPLTEGDTDGDTIPDVIEGSDDPDQDGAPNLEDTDSDGDGVPDTDEGIGDPDGDGIPSFLDLDSDGNGIPDAVEGADDPDGDRVPNSRDEDNDGDGRTDWYEGMDDPDSDGVPSYLDLDSNGDGVLDADEPVVIYVDKAGVSDDQDGLSWETAFTTVQEGIELASMVGRNEVWVAEGVYDELRDSDSGSVVMKEDVHLYGGFAGNEDAREQRDWLVNMTTIDGSVARAGEPAFHVVIGIDNATLDGFVITGGSATGSGDDNEGGGMFNKTSSPTVTNCVFQSNSAEYGGAGMYNTRYSSPVVTNCDFRDNEGGGMYNGGFSNVTVTNCIFENNSGSGMFNHANLTVENCVFRGNSADWGGGGMRNEIGSPIVKNCLFEGNTADQGGAIWSYDSSPTIVNCTFVDNSATDGGGAIANLVNRCLDCFMTVTNCIFWDNSPDTFNAWSVDDCVVTFSDVQGGYDGDGNIDADPLFVDPENGDFRLQQGSPCISAGTDGMDMGAFQFGDVTGNQEVDAVDIQMTINCALELQTCDQTDIDGNGATDATDIQLVINVVLGVEQQQL